MKKKNVNTLVGLGVLLSLCLAFYGPLLTHAQTYSTSTVYATTTNGTVTGASTSTIGSSGLGQSTQIMLLQTQVVVLLGNLISRIAAQTETNSSLVTLTQNLRLAWVGLAQTQITRLQTFLNNGR